MMIHRSTKACECSSVLLIVSVLNRGTESRCNLGCRVLHSTYDSSPDEVMPLGAVALKCSPDSNRSGKSGKAPRQRSQVLKQADLNLLTDLIQCI